MPRAFAYLILVFLALGTAAYALTAYGLLPIGQLVHPAMRANFQLHSTLVYTHISLSSLALALGAFQFSEAIRTRRPQLHRWLGRAYLFLGVLPGGIAGFIMAVHAFGGIISQLGFGILALLWLWTGAQAYLAIRHGRVQEHRCWMIRNYALCCAAITLRIYLPISLLLDAFVSAYPYIAWLCWIPNLMYAEWRITRLRSEGVINKP